MRPCLLRYGIGPVCCWLILLSAHESCLQAQESSRLDVSANSVTRRWVDRSGTFNANAKLITIHGAFPNTSVTLRLDSGADVNLDIARLSEDDNKFVQNVYREESIKRIRIERERQLKLNEIQLELDKKKLELAKKQLEIWDEFLAAPGRF